MRTVDWHDNGVRMIDQRLLPNRFETPVYHDYREVAKAITDMVVRGAPAIGGAAALGWRSRRNKARPLTVCNCSATSKKPPRFCERRGQRR